MEKVERKVTVLFENGDGTVKQRKLSKEELEEVYLEKFRNGMPYSNFVNEDFIRKMGDSVYYESERRENISRGEKEIPKLPLLKRSKMFTRISNDFKKSFRLYDDTLNKMNEAIYNYEDMFVSDDALSNIEILPSFQLMALKIFIEDHPAFYPNKETYIEKINYELERRGKDKYFTDEITEQARKYNTLYLSSKDVLKEDNAEITDIERSIYRLFAICEDKSFNYDKPLTNEDKKALEFLTIEELLGFSSKMKGCFLEEIKRLIGAKLYEKDSQLKENEEQIDYDFDFV